ncbi:hypothetical protein E1A91_A01G169200v1 [Gossypium mustelinum]|uniref:Uncharacterized protein n=1 Tax=Gossypium mustelinum TaxID=34275 RepID=A0A5D3AG11_GOSMU|nr:hypothetical protein E1A91_A01G169200v1 [Gossypium mustelinum]
MGNCVTVYKNKDPADIDLSARIQSPIKENNVRREPSIFTRDGYVSNLPFFIPLSSWVTLTSGFKMVWIFCSINALCKIGSCLACVIKCAYNFSPGNTEESFFDSQPSLESDFEDFFSANGDSASSSGNSPNHQKSNHSMEGAVDAHGESPTDTKKQLIELFRESLDSDDDGNSAAGSSKATPYRRHLPRKDVKAAESAQCCLPSLVRNMSFGERKKRLPSPAAQY